MDLKKFSPLNVSSKFAICGLPIRVDTYKTCSFGCQYCFANNRKIMEFEKTLNLYIMVKKNAIMRYKILDTLLSN